MPACYVDRISLFPGESFLLHASSETARCGLEIARVGRERVIVMRSQVMVGNHPRPDHADRDGCGWPVATEVKIPADWTSGYYDIVLTDAEGVAAHHFVCVKSTKGTPTSKAVLVLTTNTLHAYNYWGGASAYADVEALMSRRATLPEAMAGAIGRLSTQRPFPPLLLAAPADMPRLVNGRKRGFEERPWTGGDPVWSRAHGQSPYDGSAGYLNKWEHHFVRWAAEEGITLDYLTDHDLDVIRRRWTTIRSSFSSATANIGRGRSARPSTSLSRTADGWRVFPATPLSGRCAGRTKGTP